MNRTRIFASIVVCLTAILCFSCNDNSNTKINTSNSDTEKTNSDSSDNTASNEDTQPDGGEDTNTESGSGTTQRLLSSHISGGGSAQSSNYAANITVGGPAAGTASSTNYDITIGAGAIVYRK